MLDLTRFEQLWRWIELGGGAKQDLRRAALLPAAPMCAARPASTCACGRYALIQNCTLRWMVNSATGALEACGVVEIIGRVTSQELERWERGLQTLCGDRTCPAFSHCGEMRAPGLSPHADPELPVCEIID